MAIALLRKATTPPARKGDYFDESNKVQSRVFRSLKLWSLYADIEESLGSVDSCREIYDRMMELRIGGRRFALPYTYCVFKFSNTSNNHKLRTFPRRKPIL